MGAGSKSSRPHHHSLFFLHYGHNIHTHTHIHTIYYTQYRTSIYVGLVYVISVFTCPRQGYQNRLLVMFYQLPNRTQTIMKNNDDFHIKQALRFFCADSASFTAGELVLFQTLKTPSTHVRPRPNAPDLLHSVISNYAFLVQSANSFRFAGVRNV